MKKLALLTLLAAFGLGFSVGCKEEAPEKPDTDTTEIDKAVEAGKEAGEDAVKKAEDAAKDIKVPE